MIPGFHGWDCSSKVHADKASTSVEILPQARRAAAIPSPPLHRAQTFPRESRSASTTEAMQEAKHPTTTKLPSQSPPQSPSPSPSPWAPAANSPGYHHGYGTFPRPFQPAPPPQPVVGAACHDYHASPIGGFGGQGFVAALPCAVQQQVFVEGVGVPIREPPLPFCGVGVGWFLFLLGFFLAAIPWYAGAFLLFFVALDHREKPGLIACTVAGIFALIPFVLNGIRLHPFW